MSDLKSSIGISYVCIAVTRMPDTNYVRRKGGVGSEFQIIPSIVLKKKNKQNMVGVSMAAAWNGIPHMTDV